MYDGRCPESFLEDGFCVFACDTCDNLLFSVVIIQMQCHKQHSLACDAPVTPVTASRRPVKGSLLIAHAAVGQGGKEGRPYLPYKVLCGRWVFTLPPRR